LPSPQSLNLFAYVGNDPVNGIDPMGLKDAESPQEEVCKETTFSLVCEGAAGSGQESNSGSGWTVGVSGEFSFIISLLSGGGGSYGVNFQYNSDSGMGLYTYGTPADVASFGFLIGPSFTVNIAYGSGAWSGSFDSYSASGAGLAASHFQTTPVPGGDPGYIGASAGLGIGPIGYGETTTVYTPRSGGR
jgi:hypothetical protein